MWTVSKEELENYLEAEHCSTDDGGLICVSKHEQIMQTLYEAKTVMDGLSDIKEGRTVDGKTAIHDIRSEYGI